jgi:nitrogen fixation NifU-like protein
MESDFDTFADKLQEEVLEDARRHYSEVVVSNWMNPTHMGRIENSDGYGRIKGSCGDTMQFFINIDEDKICECKFITDGCGTSIACGNIVAGLAEGESIDVARKIDSDMVLKKCGGLPPEDEHCALLASTTLVEAIEFYEKQHLR